MADPAALQKLISFGKIVIKCIIHTVSVLLINIKFNCQVIRKKFFVTWMLRYAVFLFAGDCTLHFSTDISLTPLLKNLFLL